MVFDARVAPFFTTNAQQCESKAQLCLSLHRAPAIAQCSTLQQNRAIATRGVQLPAVEAEPQMNRHHPRSRHAPISIRTDRERGRLQTLLEHVADLLRVPSDDRDDDVGFPGRP
jgi:hypothetical protein